MVKEIGCRMFVAQTRKLPCCNTHAPIEPPNGRVSKRNGPIRLRLTRPFLQCGLGRTGNTVFKNLKKSSIIRLQDQATVGCIGRSSNVI